MSFGRLKTMEVGYTLDKKVAERMYLQGLRIYISGNNLWYKALNLPAGLNLDTDNLGLGVGNGLGFELLTGPSARRVGGTLKLTF